MAATAAASVLAVSIVSFAIALRIIASLHPHSGMGQPPMYGDLEAQRHWVEVTRALPPIDWYRNTTDNDLQYWGIDYPPLSAYHSWVVGTTAKYALRALYNTSEARRIYESAFGLHVSRGSETTETIIIMRVSSLITDVVVYFPAAILVAHAIAEALCATVVPAAKAREKIFGSEVMEVRDVAFGITLSCLLLVPLPLILVDHAHFQYNSASLGLILWCVYLMADPRRASPSLTRQVLGCVCGVAAILFKQMSLYFAPAIAFFALAEAVRYARFSRLRTIVKGVPIPPKRRFSFVRFIACAALHLLFTATLVAACFSPFDPQDVLRRVFPVQRGLYEDKVANVWCSVSLIFKLQRFFANNVPKLMICCATATSLAFLPGCGSALKTLFGSDNANDRPLVAFRSFVLMLHVSAGSFFLFSYQVHEKSVLLFLLPASLLLAYFSALWFLKSRFNLVPTAMSNTNDLRHCGSRSRSFLWFHTIAMFSLYPLAAKDDLVALCCGMEWLLIAPICLRNILHMQSATRVGFEDVRAVIDVAAIFAIHVVDAVYVPPPHLPAISTMLFVIYSCAGFVIALLSSTKMCFEKTLPLDMKEKHQ